MQRYTEMVQLLGTRSLMLATDVENDDYIARRFFVRFGADGNGMRTAAFQSGWRRAEDVSLSERGPSARI